MLVRNDTGRIFPFGEAIEKLKAGYFIARRAWEDNTVWVRLGGYGDEDGFDDGIIWESGAEDILAEDWAGVVDVDAEKSYNNTNSTACSDKAGVLKKTIKKTRKTIIQWQISNI